MDDDPLFKFNEYTNAGAIRWQKRALEAEAKVAELVVKFSELTLADIVFEDWHNSLSQGDRSGLSLHDLRRLVTMLVRAKPDQNGEGGSDG